MTFSTLSPLLYSVALQVLGATVIFAGSQCLQAGSSIKKVAFSFFC